MHILLVGANHRSCPIEMRERLAFHDDQLPTALRSLRQEIGLSETTVLSTCNRVEIYAAVPDLEGVVGRLSSFLSHRGGFEPTELTPRLYAHTEPDSIRHLFAVVSGLDSMVLGETEILHQVKRAYEVAKCHGATGKVFNVLFQKALHTGKTVRAKTAIGRGALSVGTVAVELAQKIFGDLRHGTVLLVGAGKIGEATLKRLAARGVSKIRIVNRSFDRAHALAVRYGGTASGLETLTGHLLDADIVITSTAAPHVLIARNQVAWLMPQRRHRPLCIIDLGVPRNIDPEVGRLENVYLFDIDDLQGLVSHHREQRRQAVLESEAIVDQKVHHFLTWRQKELVRCAPSSLELVEAP